MQTPVTAHGRIVTSRFAPHPWLRGPHAQTLLPALFRSLPELALRIQRLELDDGDFVDLGWSGEQHGTGRIAVLVHGLTGGFESKYLRGTARELIARGWCVVALQLRGGGAEPNRSVRFYNHGDTADLRHLWQWLRRQYPQARLAAAGWSLGANVLIKALAEEGEGAPVVAAAAACAPFLLEPCADKLRTGSARLYQHKLLTELKRLLRLRHGRLPIPPGVDLDGALAARDFFDFDNAYTAPLNGYRDALDYYARCSSAQFLKAIRRPTLVVSARDDPFMVPGVLPRAEQLSPCVTLEIARRGGHVGFLGADARGRPDWWLDRHLAEYLDAAVPLT